MRRLGKKKGFTLVELSISIVFISVLSLTIVFIINNTVAVYRRGVTLNQINTVGMDLVDDFRVTIQNSPPVVLEDLCEKSGVSDCNANEAAVAGLVSLQVGGDVGGVGNVPIGGAFCTGAYSYLWNSGYVFSGDADDEALSFKYNSESGVQTKEGFRLLKVKDKNRVVCKKVSEDNEVDVTGEDETFKDDDLNELLATEGSLVLYDLYAPLPATNSVEKNSLYSVSFVLGTIHGGANITATGDFCKPPNSEDGKEKENFDYCAINKFNFAAQANGG